MTPATPAIRVAGGCLGGQVGQLRVGARAGYDAYGDTANAAGLDVADTALVNSEVTGTINTQDSGLLPKSGLRLNAAAGWMFTRI